MPMICMYACNYSQQLAQMGYLRSSEICLAIPWQWYNIINQKNLCHSSTTLYRFLYISTKSINTYHQKHPAAVCGSPGQAKIIEYSQSTSIYKLHTIYILPAKTIITSQMIPCLQWLSVVSKENRLQTKLGVPSEHISCYKSALIAPLAFPASCV